MSKVFVTSDLHIGHDRGFIYVARGFESITEMNEYIVEQWNRIVSPEDTVYILGDVTLGDLEAAIPYLQRLCGNITVILGNHDTDRRRIAYEQLGWCTCYANVIKYKKYHFYLSHYPTITTNLGEESLYQAMINLYGHTHQTGHFYYDIPLMYHVGMDAHKCKPIELDTIITEIKEKINECIIYLDEQKENNDADTEN